MAELIVKKLADVASFLAGDLTDLQELIHPKNDDVQLPFSMAFAKLSTGKSSLPHRLKTSSEVYFILGGRGKLYIDEIEFEVSEGGTALVPANALQWISNTGNSELSFLCIVSPPWNKEDEWVEIQCE